MVELQRIGGFVKVWWQAWLDLSLSSFLGRSGVPTCNFDNVRPLCHTSSARSELRLVLCVLCGTWHLPRLGASLVECLRVPPTLPQSTHCQGRSTGVQKPQGGINSSMQRTLQSPWGTQLRTHLSGRLPLACPLPLPSPVSFIPLLVSPGATS